MKHFLFVTILQQSAKCLGIALLLLCYNSYSQTYNDYGFERQNIVPVHNIQGNILRYPWAGGLNSCQFSTIDLNQDGLDDLFIFDRIGNRIVTFINQGTPNQSDYVFDPSYARKFPAMSDWVRLADYNCDGKMDIFTYGYGGITIYKNTSTPSTGLTFEWKVNHLLSFIFHSYSNIFVNSVDYPAIIDMDGDGDLDILNFWIGGNYINLHKNLSMEKYGVCDSLDYIMTVACWGKVKESDTSNAIILDVPCPFKNCDSPVEVGLNDPKSIEHVGSTLTALDLNNDSVQDMLVGDNSYSTLIALINGGNKDTAYITSQIPVFPANTNPVKVNSFPAADYLDINNDGKKDLIVSPFDPSYSISENRKSVWLYKNTSTTGSPVFIFQQNNFLQDEMIDVGSGAMPLLYDVDQDGLTDLLIGNYGVYDSTWSSSGFLYSAFHSKLTLLRNTGTASSPEFTIVDTNYAGIDQLKLMYTFPTMGDIDGDGDPDMILGNKDGKIILFKNHAGPGNMPAFDPPILNYQGIDAGDYSAPQLFDLDHDNLPDLLIGTNKGRIRYYRNTGTQSSPAFTLITDTLGGIDVHDAPVSYYGYAKPCFFRTASGETRLFVGNLNHGVDYYKNIDGNLNGVFTLVGINYLFMQDGENTSVTYANLDNDTLPELVLGNASGGLAYYKGVMPGPVGIDEPGNKSNTTFNIYPNPGRGLFSVQWDNPAYHDNLTITITDLAGRVCLRLGTFNPQHDKLNLTGWKPGMYLVNCAAGGKPIAGGAVLTRRLILMP